MVSMDVLDRLMLLPLLPQEGDFVTLRMVRTLTQKIGFSADELKELGIETSSQKLAKERDEALVQYKATPTEELKKKVDDLAEQIAEAKKSGRETVVWNAEGAKGKEMPLKEKEMEFIRTALKDLSTQKKLTPQHLPLYEKFVTVEE